MTSKLSTIIITLFTVFAVLVPTSVFAIETGTVKKNFKSTFHVEARNTYADVDTKMGAVRLPFSGAVDGEEGQYVVSAAVETKKLASTYSTKFFRYATLTVTAEVPFETRIVYFLSGDGKHWEEVEPNSRHEFNFEGQDLRFKALLFTDTSEKTPVLTAFRIDYERDDVETPAALKKRDSARISDLKKLQNALDKFKKERGVYPIVQDQSLEVRYDLLGRLLLDGKFIKTMPRDPSVERDTSLRYDYISTRDGRKYILRARLEDGGRKELTKDSEIDGKPLEPHLYEYTCDDPWYCQGVGVSTPPPAPPAPEPRGTAEVVVAEDGRVYRIATVGTGPAVKRRRIYIPAPSVLEKLKTFYAQMRAIGQDELESVPRARLVKTEDKVDVYYITDGLLKRWIPNWQVFTSYGNDPAEIVTVKPEELAAYGESKLIQLAGDAKVWLLEGGVRRHISSPAIFLRHGFKWQQISPVNWTEYQTYPEGEPV